MTDDAELRARIEAQVAARRAGASPSKLERTAAGDEPDDQDDAPGSSPARGPRSLAPTRPWARPARPDQPTPAPRPPVRGDKSSRGIGPVRPWLARADEAAPPEVAPAPPPSPSPPPATGRLQPARPWAGRDAAEPGPASTDDVPAAPAPSNPDIVLRGMTAEADLAESRRDPRLARRGRPPAPAAPFVETPAPEPEPVAYVPDEQATAAFAKAVGPALEETGPAETARKRGRRRRGNIDDPPLKPARHAVGTDSGRAAATPAEGLVEVAASGSTVEAEPVAVAPAAVEPAAVESVEPAVAADAEPAPEGAADELVDAEPAAEAYPWQRQEEIDHDLHGAPTWDPAMYPPESEHGEGPRSRRALRWLFARAPESEAGEPATAGSEAPVPVPAAPSPPEPAIPAAPELAPEPEPAAAQVDEVDLGSEAALELDLADALAESPAETEPALPDAAPVEPALPDAAPVQPALPEAASVEPAATVASPATVESPTDLPLPGTDLARRLAAAHAVAPPTDDQPVTDDEAKPTRLGRLLGRRRRVDDDDEDEPYEQFELPAPDAAFEKPWLRTEPPSPTRTWTPRDDEPVEPAAAIESEPAAAADEPAPVLAPQPEPDPAAQAGPEATPEPEPAPDPVSVLKPIIEPAATVEPDPTLEPEPVQVPSPPSAEPAAAARRPSPGASRPGRRPGPSRRPSPGPRPAAARTGISGANSAATTLSGEQRHRAATGISSGTISGSIAGPSALSGRHSTGGLAPASPDLSRFLEATKPQSDDANDADDDTTDDTGKRRRLRTGGGGSSRWRRLFIRSFIIVAIAVLAAFLLRTFVVQPYYIPSASMEPTLHGCTGCNDDHVLVDKISYRAHAVHESDIIVFDRPPSVHVGEKVLIKRVIGVAGDVIQLKKGRVYLNGLLLDEPYVNKACGAEPTQPLTATTRWKVPGNDVFVMGDNRCDSEDSRAFGPIATSTIVGRAFAIIWPLNRIRLL